MNHLVVVNVSNISNDASDEEIREYLRLVGPMERCQINRNEPPKVSAKVVYYDTETALMAVRNLGSSDFRSRRLQVRIVQGMDNTHSEHTVDQQIRDEILRLDPQERSRFFFLAAKHARSEGQEFVDFLHRHEKILDAINVSLRR